MKPPTHPALRRAVTARLLPWFEREQRRLPWRGRRTPYRVWVSELMLQQTRVDQVLPYYRRFLRLFPSLRALARAPRSRVLKAWEGLGYYRRAHALHEAARRVAREHGGRLPRGFDALKTLPGVGDYTAAAIASLCWNEPVAVVDGNVIRVLARLTAWGGEAHSAAARGVWRALARDLMPKDRAGAFNEALMELGAIVCAPRKPDCPACPLQRVCNAFAEGRPASYPLPKKRKALPHRIVGAGVVTDDRGRVLVARRPDKAMLAGLWEFPGGGVEEGETVPQCIRRELKEELGIDVRVGARVTVVRHAFSHFTMDLHAHRARLVRGQPRPIQCAACRWVRPDRLDRLAFCGADREIVRLLQSENRE